jgi:hypothetical protein
MCRPTLNSRGNLSKEEGGGQVNYHIGFALENQEQMRIAHAYKEMTTANYHL